MRSRAVRACAPSTERCVSGRSGTTGNRVGAKPSRGFESLPLRTALDFVGALKARDPRDENPLTPSGPEGSSGVWDLSGAAAISRPEPPIHRARAKLWDKTHRAPAKEGGLPWQRPKAL